MDQHEQSDGNPAVAESVVCEGGVVVGHDGSAGARLAVAWAAEEARTRGCSLHVVRAWHLTGAPRPASWQPGYAPSLSEYEQAVEQDLRRDVDGILGAEPGVDVRLHVAHASPAKVLVATSETADLLVVGSRGLGGFRGLLLGSVSDQVVRHASCPVVVIRSPKANTARTSS